MNDKYADMEAAGIIQPQTRTKHVLAPVVAAKKDAEGNWTDSRVCVDMRNLNKHTRQDKYSPQNPEQLFQDMSGSRYFTKIYLRAGFHQIPIAEGDKEKTTFWWGNQTYSYQRLCFGMRNATAHFCRVMDHEIGKAGLTGNACCFVDDVLIHSATFEEHVEHVRRLHVALHGCGLRAHPEKSFFNANYVEFLGHVVSEYGLSSHEAKVAAIRAMPAPTTVSELRSVLGFCGYYRGYVPNYSAIAQPLNDLLGKDVPWEWGHAAQQALGTSRTSSAPTGGRCDELTPRCPTSCTPTGVRVGSGRPLRNCTLTGRSTWYAASAARSTSTRPTTARTRERCLGQCGHTRRCAPTCMGPPSPSSRTTSPSRS